MAEKKTKEQLKAEADARRAASKEKQEAQAKLLAERRAENKQKALEKMAAQKVERESKVAAAAAAAAAQKEARLKAAEAAKAERLALLASAKEARAAAKVAARGATPAPPAVTAAAPAAKPVSAKAAPTKAAGRAAVAAPAATPAPGKKPAKPEQVGLAIGLVLPVAVERELDRAVKTATLSVRDQVLGSLKLPDSPDKRELAKLESTRKRIVSAFEGLIAIVCGRISASPIQSASLSLDPGTGRAQFAPYTLEVANALRGRIAATCKDLLAALSDEATRKAFPALGSPFMLQFFGDLETGQVLDGSLIMTAADQAAETAIVYKVTLGAASKKVKGAALKLEFSHNLSASNAAGTVHVGFPINLPDEPPKS